MTTKPTTEERIWAVISHLSVLAFGMGLVLPIIGWSEQRRKSRYASFQCLQAFGYQSLGYTIWLLTFLILFILFLVIFAFMAGKSAPADPFIRIWGVFFGFVMLGLIGLYLLLPVIAAVVCAFGKDFQYPVLGKRLARYLSVGSSDERAESLNSEHEDRWVAAMGHFSVIIIFWGLLAPAATWILQGKNTAFLKFQSIQTTIYQVFVNILYLGTFIFSFLVSIPMMAVMGLVGNPSQSSSANLLGLILFLFSLVILSVAFLIIPLFHVLGQWAGYRVLKGDNYRYPILGKLVEKKMEKSYGVQELAPGSNSELFDSNFDSTKETL